MNSHLKRFEKIVLANHPEVVEDVQITYGLRGCDERKTNFSERFKHLMKYYPEFVYVFQWRTGLLKSSRLKSLFKYTDYQCKIFKSTKIEGGMACYHPYASVINAKNIGRNFEFRNSITIGNKSNDNRLIPTIGDNVKIGANACIIGDIKIGNNVIIGAGSIVVRDVPNNVVVAGNPARVIKALE
ncbi:serine acetyltransferase [Nonlabens spongiae]|nr:serine acetyltransferase [Nonlabens spongiae]